MTVKEILIDWLKDHGYDGLCNCDIECGCLIEDLIPCEYVNDRFCEAGYRVPCMGGCGEEECDSHVSPVKSKK
jgi:hypothetical protein